MSATLKGSELSARLGSAPLIQAPGRVFPVEIRYTPESAQPMEERVTAAVASAMQETSGHVLVFLPGAAEIRKTIAACEPVARRLGAALFPLHGDLGPEEQDAAVAPSATRKIICSTNVAESSVTIEGVQAVVDSGVARILSHSPWSGISRLQVEKISQASAIQRAGRAGRTGPGLAIRLYSESDFVRRPHHLEPEILRGDLAQLLLQLAALGLSWPDLDWIDEPPRELREHAADLLTMLGVLDSRGRLTEAGERIGKLPLHPRLGRLADCAAGFGAPRAGAELAARLAEGRMRVEEGTRSKHLSDIDALLAADLSYDARRLMQQILDGIRNRQGQASPHALDKAVLAAYPDRVARRKGETLLLSNGRSARLDRNSAVTSEFLVAVEVDDRREGGGLLVRIASPIEPDWLLELFPERVSTLEDMVWNREPERVEQVNSLRYDQVVID